MDEHKSMGIADGWNTNQTARPNQKVIDRILLTWAISASLVAVLFLGLLLFQPRRPQETKRASEPDEVDIFDSGLTDLATAGDLEPPPLPPLPEIFVSDLRPVVFTSGYDQPNINKSVAGNPLRVGGRTYDHGLGTHANSQAIFDIPVDARRFVAVVGLDDEVANDKYGRGSVLFKVFGDRNESSEAPELLAHSPLLSAKTIRSWAFDLNLDARFKRIELIASDARDGADCDHADWVNPGFLRQPR